MSDQNAIVVSQSAYLAPITDVKTALMRYQAVKDFIGSILKEGVDYGKIPGAGDKPTLLKPGAEKMCSFFGFSVRFILVEKVEDWTGENHGNEPFFYYQYRAQLWRGDVMAAEGDGSANSWEKKYRYRQAQRICPDCGQPAIFKSKDRPEYYCWSKKGGCGAKFPISDPRINEQEVGQVKNPDVADTVNTIQKMAQKRALLAPVLIATNTSDYFTQDIEDFVTGEWRDEPPAKQQPTNQTQYLYADGLEVAPQAVEAYVAYIAEHNGNPPDNVYNLRNWYKKNTQPEQPAN
jgi:hypothetical protein